MNRSDMHDIATAHPRFLETATYTTREQRRRAALWICQELRDTEAAREVLEMLGLTSA